MLFQCPFMPGSHSLLLFDPCQQGGTVAVPILQVERVRLPDSEMRSMSRSRGAGVWTEPPLAAMMLSLTLCASWTLPRPPPPLTGSPASWGVGRQLPKAAHRGARPRGQAATFQEGPEGTRPSPPPELLADFTSTFWVLPAEPMPPLHPPAQLPQPWSVSH